MKSPARLAGLLLALGALSAPAWAGPGPGCVFSNVDGPRICNCTDDDTSISLCTSSEVQVSSTSDVSVTGNWPGLSATGGMSFSQTVSIGATYCANPTLPPHTCEWWLYRFKVCIQYVLHESVFGDKLVPETTVTFLGVSLKSDAATSDDC